MFNRNIGALVIACLADWIFMTFLLIYFWHKLFIPVKILIFVEIIYTIVILVGSIVTRIQDKRIADRLMELRLYDERS